MATQDYTICSICGDTFPCTYHCTQCHEGVCHPCAEISCHQALGYYDHPAPQEWPPASLVLSPRDVAALVQYQQHVQRVVGTGPLRDLVTGEEAP